MQQDYHRSKRGKKKTVGHMLKLQVAGYKWLSEVRADALGVNFIDMSVVEGRANALGIMDPDVGAESSMQLVRNALKLVSEVTPHRGGRMLCLRSVFSVVNNTTHSIHLLASDSFSRDKNENVPVEDGNTPFLLHEKEEFHIPAALLHRSAVASCGKFLGKLSIKPSDINHVRSSFDELTNLIPDTVDYSFEHIDLFDIVSTTSELFSSDLLSMDPEGTTLLNSNGDVKGLQLCCHIQGKTQRAMKLSSASSMSSMGSSSQLNTLLDGQSHGSGSPQPQQQIEMDSGDRAFTNNKLPPFCYNIEIQRFSSTASEQAASSTSADNSLLNKITFKKLGNFFQKESSKSILHPSVHYSIGKSLFFLTIICCRLLIIFFLNHAVIHPPIMLENLLPCEG